MKSICLSNIGLTSGGWIYTFSPKRLIVGQTRGLIGHFTGGGETGRLGGLGPF